MNAKVKIPDNNKFRFGREDLSFFYKELDTHVFNQKVNRVIQYNETSTRKELILCNIWKIILHKNDSSLSYQRYDLKSSWIDCDYDSIPKITLVPFTTHLNLWQTIIKSAIWDIANQLGYDELKNPSDFGEYNPQNKKMRNGRMMEIFINSYIKKLNIDIMQGYVKKLRKILYKDFIDRELFRIALSIDFRYLELQTYFYYSKNATGLKKIYSEHPNLIPLIRKIKPNYWERDDLFSRKLWIKNGRKTTLVDRLSFNAHERVKLNSFNDTSTFKYLMKSKHSVINAWCENGCNHLILDILAIATRNIPLRIPVIALRHLIYSFSEYLIKEHFKNTPDLVIRTYHLYLKNVSVIWLEQGHAAVKNHIQGSSLSEVMDWLRYDGFAKSLPSKNTTWLSLVRMTNTWHEENIIRQTTENLEWPSPINSIVIDDVIITALTSSIALRIEGQQLKHCVGNYDDVCYDGFYLVFSFTESNSVRSTLGLDINQKTKKYKLHQHYGSCNSAVSPDASAVADKFIKLLNSKNCPGNKKG